MQMTLRLERCSNLPRITLQSQDQKPSLSPLLFSEWNMRWNHLEIVDPLNLLYLMENSLCPWLISLGFSSLGERLSRRFSSLPTSHCSSE